jgi:nitrate reductase gamma subunit
LPAGPQFCCLVISPYWRPVSLVFAQAGERNQHFAERKRNQMGSTLIIQIVCGVLAVVGIIILVLRRRGKNN